MSSLTSNLLKHADTPTGREEAWRFTPLKRLAGLHDRETDVVDQPSLFQKRGDQAGFSLKLVAADSVPPISTTDDVIVERIVEVPVTKEVFVDKIVEKFIEVPIEIIKEVK